MWWKRSFCGLIPVDESEAAASVGNGAGTVQPHPTSGLHHPSHAAGQSGKGRGRGGSSLTHRGLSRCRCWCNPSLSALRRRRCACVTNWPSRSEIDCATRRARSTSFPLRRLGGIYSGAWRRGGGRIAAVPERNSTSSPFLVVAPLFCCCCGWRDKDSGLCSARIGFSQLTVWSSTLESQATNLTVKQCFIWFNSSSEHSHNECTSNHHFFGLKPIDKLYSLTEFGQKNP